jgi:hypothetical protein
MTTILDDNGLYVDWTCSFFLYQFHILKICLIQIVWYVSSDFLDDSKAPLYSVQGLSLVLLVGSPLVSYLEVQACMLVLISWMTAKPPCTLCKGCPLFFW